MRKRESLPFNCISSVTAVLFNNGTSTEETVSDIWVGGIVNEVIWSFDEDEIVSSVVEVVAVVIVNNSASTNHKNMIKNIVICKERGRERERERVYR